MRTLLLVILAFLAGYIIRDYFGPTSLPWVTKISQSILTADTKKNAVPGNVEITYENGEFKPKEATIGVSRYLTVINKSDQLMWIESDYPGLVTPRGYGHNELVRVKVEKFGDIHIHNKFNTNATAVVKVGQ